MIRGGALDIIAVPEGVAIQHIRAHERSRAGSSVAITRMGLPVVRLAQVDWHCNLACVARIEPDSKLDVTVADGLHSEGGGTGSQQDVLDGPGAIIRTDGALVDLTTCVSIKARNF